MNTGAPVIDPAEEGGSQSVKAQLRLREMILADTATGRRAALDKLLPMQRSDFLKLFEIMAGLPVTINNFVQSPYAYWKQLAWSGALLITLTVLALNIGARILGAERTAK